MSKDVNAERIIGNYAYVNCPCGSHLVDLFDTVWNDRNMGFYTCNACERPLVCKGDDGHYYFVGERIK